MSDTLPFAVACLRQSSDGKIQSRRYATAAEAEQTARFLADRNNTPFVVLAPAKTIYPGDKALGLFDQR